MPAAETLTPKTRRDLKARAHALKPVVWIAQRGLTESTLHELDRALTAHELIKVHAAIDEREERARLLETLCRLLSAEPVQLIGKILIAYRPRPPEPVQTRAPRRSHSFSGRAGATAPDSRRPRRVRLPDKKSRRQG